MLYNFNGKTLKIPDNEITNNMKLLGISQKEAIEVWLDDNDYTINEVVEELSKKAKENKAVKHSAKSVSTEKKAPVKRERKPDEEKIQLISLLADALKEYNPKIENVSKIITFSVGENNYKLDLIRQRGEKKGKA